jgi:hypothetical protein
VVKRLTGATCRDEATELARLGLLPARAARTPSFAIRLLVVMPRMALARTAAAH